MIFKACRQVQSDAVLSDIDALTYFSFLSLLDARPDSDLGYEDAAPDGNYRDEDGGRSSRLYPMVWTTLPFQFILSLIFQSLFTDTYHTSYNDEKYSQGLYASRERKKNHNKDGNAMMQPDRRGKFIGNSRTRSAEWSVATVESYGEYGAGTDDEGDNDEGRDGGALPPRRTRYRRRGSVTKYSLETAETVKKEYEETNTILNQYRQGGGDVSSGDKGPQEKQAAVKPTLMPDSFDFPIPHVPPEETGADTRKNEKKLKKGGGLRRFTMR